MKEIVKKIWNNPVWSNVIAGIILILINALSFVSPSVKKILLIPIPLWGCLFIIFIVFISTRLLIHFSKKEKEKRAESERNKRHNKLTDRQEKERANLILTCLNNEDFEKLSKLYNSTKIQLDNRPSRIVPSSDYIYYYPTIEKTYTPIDKPGSRYVNILSKSYADQIVYTFYNKYFYSILENYVKTGKKEKIEI